VDGEMKLKAKGKEPGFAGLFQIAAWDGNRENSFFPLAFLKGRADKVW
jgi:hypothetical protein